MHRLRPISFTLPFLFAAGCGTNTESVPNPPVVGKVAFKQGTGDVRWLVGGKVRLESVRDPQVVAVGVIDEDGSFAADTHTPAAGGIPPGEYAVSVIPPADRDAAPRDSPVLAKYQSSKTSGLRASVPAAEPLTLTVEGPRPRW